MKNPPTLLETLTAAERAVEQNKILAAEAASLRKQLTQAQVQLSALKEDLAMARASADLTAEDIALLQKMQATVSFKRNTLTTGDYFVTIRASQVGFHGPWRAPTFQEAVKSCARRP